MLKRVSRFLSTEAATLPKEEGESVMKIRRAAWRPNRANEPPFRLTDTFLSKYANKKPPFGFNGLGEVVYLRTYSRMKENNQKETWAETVARVVNGTYNMQKRWIEQHSLGWDKSKSQISAQKMYDKIFNMKFLPPGRGLWAMGSPITEDRGIFAALNNCAFVSTANMWEPIAGQTPSKPFAFLMDASMLGVGVGFDTNGAGKDPRSTVFGPDKSKKPIVFSIPDSREGWVDSVKMLIDSYFLNSAKITFDYSEIRGPGQPIKGFGGISSGPNCLIELHNEIRNILDNNIGSMVTVTTIVDIMNVIGKCVVSGNVRRTAEIAFGSPNSEEYINLKNYSLNPQRSKFGWTSNNSVFASLGMNYGDVCERIVENGEPGFFWLSNAQEFGRMVDQKNNKDARALGGNPCLEQTLESYELCCLVETFPFNHDTLEEYLDTLKYAYLYAKTVTLGSTHWPETNRVTLRNRRIGCSMSGVAQFIESRGLEELRRWCEKGYNFIQEEDISTSDWLAIPRSIKTTSIKPSGTVSLLAGATPGMHYPEARFCIRRIRLAIDSELIPPLKKAGYKIEPCAVNGEHTVVVEFPIDHGKNIRCLKNISFWEQLSLASFLQKYWSDNQVSSTITFDPETEGTQLKHALDYFQYQLKGISFLPRGVAEKAYAQMPIEEIDEKKYLEMKANIDENFSIASENIRLRDNEMIIEKFCDGDSCIR